MVICKNVCKVDFLYILQYEIMNLLHVSFYIFCLNSKCFNDEVSDFIFHWSVS